jgi:7-cyano-7-deazaguanine synthase in queuosine biosynthesis
MKGWNFYVAIVIFIVGLVIYSLIYNNKQQLSLPPQIIVYPEPVYNVFWTGGYDSTFLVLYLLKFGNVRPVYLKGDSFTRYSKDKEINAMDTVRQSIRSTYKLLPTIYVNNQILDQDILDAEYEAKEFYTDKKKFSNVQQYKYIAQYCKDNNFIGHVGIVRSNNKWQNLPVIDKGTTRCRNETIRFFKNFRFPSIHLSKHEMRLLLNNDDVLKKTWSCRNPVEGVACGTCSVCKKRVI